MIDTLKAGPLAGQDLLLLRAGSSVLRPTDPNADVLLTFTGIGNSPGYIRIIDPGSNLSHGPHGYFSYIGERGEDGWITAPEGGWSENPVAGMTVDLLKRNGNTLSAIPSNDTRWKHREATAFTDIIAFRPVSAPPAAVEGGDQSWPEDRERELGDMERQGSSAAPIPTEGRDAAVVDRDPVSEFVAEYEFRGETDYTPTDDERALIEDAIHGFLASRPDDALGAASDWLASTYGPDVRGMAFDGDDLLKAFSAGAANPPAIAKGGDL